MSIFPHGRQPRTEILTLGPVDESSISIARSALEETYGLSATVREGPSLERFEPNDDRGQYEVYDFLEAVLESSDADLVIGLTSADVTMRRRAYVFGAGYLGEPAAVVSTYRLEPEHDRFPERLARQVVTQAARTFGLEAIHGGCVLERTAVVEDLDRTSKIFCESCRSKLTDPSTAPRPPDWVVREAERGGDDEGGSETDDESGGLPSITPLEVVMLPFVLVTLALAPFAIALSRLLAWESRLPEDLRRVLHGTYRIGRFWAVVLAFFAATIVVLVVQFGLYDRLAGGDPGTRLVWGMLVVAAIVGYLLQFLCRAFLGAVYEEFTDF